MPDRWQYDYLNFHTIGNAYLHLGYYDKARSFLEKSLKGFDETEQFDNKYAALFDLSELHKKTKDYQKALYYFSYAQSVKDSVIGTDLQNQIGQISSDYELKAKQKQIEVEQKQKRLVYMLLFILLLLFVGIILSYLRAIKVNKLLALKRQKIEEQATLLSESNATKDKLFAMLSHDLRGPINNVVNYLYLLEDNYAPPQSYIDKLRFSLENVQLILNNLFNWAELQIRNSPPTLKHVSVDLVLDKVLQQFDDSIKDKEIKILNSLRGDMVWADENYLQIILRNVISNAMKFTSQKGEIKIETENHKSHTHIIVYDTGVGIAPLQLEKVFNYPTSSVGTKNEKGTGLGLTLCKELMEKQGGTVSISSQLGLGTVVSLRFPFVTRLA